VTILDTVSIWALIVSGISFLLLALDLFGHPQKMMIMNFVWPITALYSGPFAV
jgi:hypothetical protein